MKPISKTKRAFTLVELLVVITIIALLAALTVGLYSRVKSKAVESTILAEMEQVKLALQSYKEKHGIFPPSPPPPLFPLSDPANNKLYYYLSGEAELMRAPDLTDLTQLHSMNPGEIKERRMKGGIKNLLPNLKKEQFDEALGILYSPAPDKDDSTKRAQWIYQSGAPTHNRETYDLSVKITDGIMVKTKRVFEWLDADKDNILSAEEISKPPEELKTLDLNKDGQLTFGELEILDWNNDGQLTDEDYPNEEEVMVLDIKEIGNW